MRSKDERPPALLELQRSLAARVLPPKPSEPAPRADLALEDWIRLPGPVRAADRLAVYVNGHPARVREALSDAFPAVQHVIGERLFTELARRYVERRGLPSYNLNHAGAGLPEHLAGDPLADDYPFLPDLARLEWGVTCSFHAHAEPPLDPVPLAQWSLAEWERAVLRFQPWVAVVSSPWPILQIWRAREIPVEEIDIDLRDHPEHVLVRRAGLTVHAESISPEEARALAALLDGRRLGEVIDDLVAADREAEQVFAWFRRWIEIELVAGCLAVKGLCC
jgi:hypothetical protein